MNNRKWIWPAAGLLFFLGVLGPAPEKAFCGGLFLVDGVGLQGRLEIGGTASGTAKQKRDEPGWYGLDGLPVYFMKTGGNRVTIIRCDKYCLTNRSISNGSSVKEVLWNYGTPLEEKMIKDKKFLVYRGVGFLLDTNNASVESIYILPAAAERQQR